MRERERERERERSMAESDLSSKVKGSRWSLKGTTALVTGGTRGIGSLSISSSSSFVIQIKPFRLNLALLIELMNE